MCLMSQGRRKDGRTAERTDRRTGRRTDRWTDRRTDRRADKQTYERADACGRANGRTGGPRSGGCGCGCYFASRLQTGALIHFPLPDRRHEHVSYIHDRGALFSSACFCHRVKYYYYLKPLIFSKIHVNHNLGTSLLLEKTTTAGTLHNISQGL